MAISCWISGAFYCDRLSALVLEVTEFRVLQACSGELICERICSVLPGGHRAKVWVFPAPAEAYESKVLVWSAMTTFEGNVFPRVFVLAAMLLIPAGTITSQQPMQSQRFPQFENEDVAVWRTVVTPNAPLNMHTHQHPRVIVALSGGRMKVVYDDQTSESHSWETGHAYWLDINEGKKRHADVNVGDKPIEVMVVELKKSN